MFHPQLQPSGTSGICVMSFSLFLSSTPTSDTKAESEQNLLGVIPSYHVIPMTHLGEYKQNTSSCEWNLSGTITRSLTSQYPCLKRTDFGSKSQASMESGRHQWISMAGTLVQSWALGLFDVCILMHLHHGKGTSGTSKPFIYRYSSLASPVVPEICPLPHWSWQRLLPPAPQNSPDKAQLVLKKYQPKSTNQGGIPMQQLQEPIYVETRKQSLEDQSKTPNYQTLQTKSIYTPKMKSNTLTWHLPPKVSSGIVGYSCSWVCRSVWDVWFVLCLF